MIKFFTLSEKYQNSKQQIWPIDKNFEIFIPEREGEPMEREITGLKLKNGAKYLLCISALNFAGYGSFQESMGVTVDTTPPVVSQVSFDMNTNEISPFERIYPFHGCFFRWCAF